MKMITISDLAYLMKQAKKRGEPQPIFFLGAGASKTGNIPLAQEIVQDILIKYSDSPFINKLNDSDKHYAKLMECLQPFERNDLLKGYIDNAKINVTHIYLAQLLRNGFVDYILTVNFDNLMLRALSLYNEFPATYDMAILKDLTTTTIREKSVVYLHGQHHGLWLLNTADEMGKVNSTLPRIFDSIKNKRPWVLIGYSGSDPVFKHIKNLGRFDNGLYWIGYKDNEPGVDVKEFLNTENTNSYYIKGYDSDAFMLKLNESLDLGQPKILDKPFSCLRDMVEEIVDINEEEHFKGVKERLEIAKKDIENSIRQFEMKEIIQIEQNELDVDSLKKQIINLIISEEFDLQKIETIEKKAFELKNDGVNSLLSGFFSDWGVELGDLAQTKEGEEVEELYSQAFEKFKKSVDIKSDKYEPYNNWGICLADLAQVKKGKDAEELYLQAFEKFQKSVEIDSGKHETFNNWGRCLAEFAQTKNGKDAEELYLQAFEKFQKSAEINQADYEVFYNWGTYLGYLAQIKEGKDAEELYLQAFEKFQKAVEINPYNHESFNNWGVSLADLGQIKKGVETENLYHQAFEKFQRSFEICPDDYETLFNWGTYLGYLAVIKGEPEAEYLYHQSFEKFKRAIELNPDNHKIFNNWGANLGRLAKLKEGVEAKELYHQAFEKFQKSLELGGGAYNLSCIYALKQDKENALKYLDVSLSNKEVDVEFVLEDKDWMLYHDDENFALLTEKYLN